MNRRNLLLLGTAAGGSIAAAILLTPDRTEPPVSSAVPLAFPNLAARLASAGSIEVRRHDGTLLIKRDGPDRWVLPAKSDYPVRPERVRELLVGLTELRFTEPRTANPEMLERLGVDDPTRPGSTASLLRVLDAQGQPIVELVLGRRRVRMQGNVPESIYVRRPSESQTWLAEGRLPLDGDPNLWIDRDLTNIARERVRSLRVTREGEPPLFLQRGPDGDAPLRVIEPAETPELDEVSLDEVARAFEFLTFLDVKPAAEIPGTRVGEGRFELTDNLTLTLTLHKDGDTLWALIAAGGDEEAARLNARFRGWAYQVGQWKEKAFAPRLADLTKPPPEAPAEAPAETPAPQ
jgi:hypothetical protein